MNSKVVILQNKGHIVEVITTQGMEVAVLETHQGTLDEDFSDDQILDLKGMSLPCVYAGIVPGSPRVDQLAADDIHERIHKQRDSLLRGNAHDAIAELLAQQSDAGVDVKDPKFIKTLIEELLAYGDIGHKPGTQSETPVDQASLYKDLNPEYMFYDKNSLRACLYIEWQTNASAHSFNNWLSEYPYRLPYLLDELQTSPEQQHKLSEAYLNWKAQKVKGSTSMSFLTYVRMTLYPNEHDSSSEGGVSE